MSAKVTLLKSKTHPVPTANYELVTPGCAQTWLDSAARNRNLVFRRIEQYADMMKRGDWLLNGQGLIFDEDEKLIDGQHRLHAIIRADIPVTMLVVRSVRSISQLVIDQGARRTPHDQISLREGFDVAPIHVAVAKSMLQSVGGPGQKKWAKMLTDIQLMDRYYVKHKRAVEFAVGRFTTGHTGARGVTIAPVFAPVARAYYTENQTELLRFIDVVATGMAESRDESAAVTLRNWLMSKRDQGLSSRSYGDRYIIYKKTEVALRAFLKGEQIQRLGQMTTEVELFPLP